MKHLLGTLLLACLRLLLRPWSVQRRPTGRLYIKIEEDGSLKLGTCQHCVVEEAGRPTRAWDPNGDAELDFPRDQLIQRLTAFGLKAEIDQEYICP